MLEESRTNDIEVHSELPSNEKKIGSEIIYVSRKNGI